MLVLLSQGVFAATRKLDFQLIDENWPLFLLPKATPWMCSEVTSFLMTSPFPSCFPAALPSALDSRFYCPVLNCCLALGSVGNSCLESTGIPPAGAVSQSGLSETPLGKSGCIWSIDSWNGLGWKEP